MLFDINLFIIYGLFGGGKFLMPPPPMDLAITILPLRYANKITQTEVSNLTQLLISGKKSKDFDSYNAAAKNQTIVTILIILVFSIVFKFFKSNSLKFDLV